MSKLDFRFIRSGHSLHNFAHALRGTRLQGQGDSDTWRRGWGAVERDSQETTEIRGHARGLRVFNIILGGFIVSLPIYLFNFSWTKR